MSDDKQNRNYRIGVAFAVQYYENFVKDGGDPYVMLDDDTTYTTGEGTAAASQLAAFGRQAIKLDKEVAIFRGKQLQLASVDTQETVDEGLLVLVNGAVLDLAHPQANRTFVQTFFLGKDPQEGGFFVRNTVIRFLAHAVEKTPDVAAAAVVSEKKTPSASASAAPAKDEKKSAIAAAPAPVSAPVTAPAPAASSSASAAAPADKKHDEKKQEKSNKKDETTKPAQSKTAATTATATSGKKDEAKPAQQQQQQKKASEQKSDNSKTASAPTAASVSAPAPAPEANKAPSSFLDAVRRPGAGPAAPRREKKKEETAAAPNAAATTTSAANAATVTGAGASGKKEKEKSGSREGSSNGASPAGGAAGKKTKKEDGERKGGERKERDEKRGGGKEENSILPHAQIYVSNIKFGTTDEDLSSLLNQFGKVKSIVRPVGKGYGFVEYFEDKDARKAISNPTAISLTLDGRELKLEERTGQVSGRDKKPRNNHNGERSAAAGGGAGGGDRAKRSGEKK